MNKCGAEEIETKSCAANDHNKKRVIDGCILLGSSITRISETVHEEQHSRWMLMNRSMDCRRILIPKAKRKTPLKKAPMRRALCQPKERSWRAVAFAEI